MLLSRVFVGKHSLVSSICSSHLTAVHGEENSFNAFFWSQTLNINFVSLLLNKVSSLGCTVWGSKLSQGSLWRLLSWCTNYGVLYFRTCVPAFCNAPRNLYIVLFLRPSMCVPGKATACLFNKVFTLRAAVFRLLEMYSTNYWGSSLSKPQIQKSRKFLAPSHG